MRLISVQIEGYKRFERPATLWFTSPLIAIVGPNEAGKTSFLEALAHLSRNARISRTEFTDRREPVENAVVVSARFAVERADRDALPGLLDEAEEYVLKITKRVGEPLSRQSLHPPLYRDTEPRRQLIENLRQILAEELLVERTSAGVSDEETIDSELSDQAALVAERLAAAEEDLTSGTLKALSDLIAAVRDRYGEQPARASIAELLEHLDRLHAHENEENPHDRASVALNERRPSVAKYLRELGYSMQANRKTKEGSKHPDRDAQFRHINATVASVLARGEPAISVDTKKKELVGDFKNGGREWRPKGDPIAVRVHDFKDEQLGKVNPYGVYDIAPTRAGSASASTTTPRSSRSRRSAAGGSSGPQPATRRPKT